MVNPFTAADPDDEFLFEDTEFEAMPTGYAVQAEVSEGIPDYTPILQAAAERIRAQRAGMSNREKLGALLVGFGQPTRHGKWQEGVSNAASVMFQLSQKQREAEERRREKLAELETRIGIAGETNRARIEAAKFRAGAKGPAGELAAALGHKPNADEVKRIGYAKRLWPDFTPEEIVKVMYHPKIEAFMLRPGVASGAASGGYDVVEAIDQVSGSLGNPTLTEFLIEARKVNPGVSDADLTAYYNSKYGEK